MTHGQNAYDRVTESPSLLFRHHNHGYPLASNFTSLERACEGVIEWDLGRRGKADVRRPPSHGHSHASIGAAFSPKYVIRKTNNTCISRTLARPPVHRCAGERHRDGARASDRKRPNRRSNVGKSIHFTEYSVAGDAARAQVPVCCWWMWNRVAFRRVSALCVLNARWMTSRETDCTHHMMMCAIASYIVNSSLNSMPHWKQFD